MNKATEYRKRNNCKKSGWWGYEKHTPAPSFFSISADLGQIEKENPSENSMGYPCAPWERKSLNKQVDDELEKFFKDRIHFPGVIHFFFFFLLLLLLSLHLPPRNEVRSLQAFFLHLGIKEKPGLGILVKGRGGKKKIKYPWEARKVWPVRDCIHSP